MGREIKFRAWDKEEKKMRYQSEHWRIESEYSYVCFPFPAPLDSGEDEKYELMQFTGIKDWKGNEVWEGDIVSLKIMSWKTKSPLLAIVKFYAPFFCLFPFDEPEGKGTILVTPSDIREVVGNIYEHKGLGVRI